MPPLAHALIEVAASSLSKLASDLGQIGKRIRGGEAVPRPLVELLLQGGHRVKGVILDASGQQPHIALWTENTSVLFVALTDVIGIIRCDLAELERPQTSTLSRLDLARRLTARAQTLGVRLDLADGVHEADSLAAAGALADDLEVVLAQLAEDELGRTALADLSALRVTVASRPAASRDGTVIEVVAVVAPLDRWDRARLRQELERLL